MKGFIIDTYNHRSCYDRNSTIYHTHLGDTEIAIKEVEIVDGLPQVP